MLILCAAASTSRAGWQTLDGRLIYAVDFYNAHLGLLATDDQNNTIYRIDGSGLEDGIFNAPARVTDLAIQDSNVAWAMVFGHGLYKGSANWAIWENVNANLDAHFIATTPGKLWMMNNGVFSFTTDGRTIDTVTGLIDNDTVVAIDYVDRKILIAVAYHNVYRTTDGGVNWSAVETGGAAPASVYVDRVHGLVYTGGDQLRKSVDSGATFTVIVPPIQFGYTAYDGLVFGAHDCSGVFYITNARHANILRADNLGTAFHLTGFPPNGQFGMRRGWVFNRGQILYWFDRLNLVSASHDGIDSSLDFRVTPFVTVTVDPIQDTICTQIPTSFKLSFLSSICIPVRIDGATATASKGAVTTTFKPFDLKDSAAIFLKYLGSDVGTDSIVLQITMHSSEGTSREVMTLSVRSTNTTLPAVLESTDSIDFGQVHVDSTKSSNFHLSNSGCEALRVDSVVSTNVDVFAVAPLASGTSVLPGKAVDLAVRFTPHKAGKVVESIEVGTSVRHRFVKLSGIGVSQVNGVKSHDEPIAVRCFPDPAANSITFTGLAENSELAVFDILGRPVMQLKAAETSVVNVAQLPPGSYVAISGGQRVRFSIAR